MPETSTPIAPEELRETVRAKYAAQARRVTSTSSACCEPSCCGGDTATADPITGDLYATDDVASVPEDALKASLGCGNPTALASLAEGETSAVAAASTSCCRRDGSARAASPTVWT